MNVKHKLSIGDNPKTHRLKLGSLLAESLFLT